jgi:anti-anti-sigma factor
VTDPQMAREGDWLIVAWPGEIDMTNADSLQAETLGAVRNTDAGVTMDLTGVSYIDSAGIRSLLTIRGLLADRQQQLSVVLPEGSMLTRALEISGVPAVVPIFRSVDAARKHR